MLTSQKTTQTMLQVEIHLHVLESKTMCFRSPLHSISLLHCPLNVKFAQNSDAILTGLAAAEDFSSHPLPPYCISINSGYRQADRQTGRVSWGV